MRGFKRLAVFRKPVIHGVITEQMRPRKRFAGGREMDFLITVLQTILGFLSLFICTLVAAVVVRCSAAGCICGRAGLASAYTVKSASLDNTVKSQSESAPSFLSCLKTKLERLFDANPRSDRPRVIARAFYRKSPGAAR
jgi:hypothetical protein